MRVLWLSNCVLGENKSNASGSWLYAMKDILAGEVELWNMAESRVSEAKHTHYDGFDEYEIPFYPKSKGVPSAINIKQIEKIIDEIKPDVIHVWGIEKYWALLFTRGLIHRDAIIELQGVMSSCYNAYQSGLLPSEIRQCNGFWELVFPRDRFNNKRKSYLPSIAREKEILSTARFISTQSDWTRGQIHFYLNKDAVLYKTKRPVRNCFYNSIKWGKPDHEDPVIFTSSSYSEPYKGLHILLRAVALLKKKYSGIKLEIAGVDFFERPWYRTRGMDRFWGDMVKKLDLMDNIVFLGHISGEQIIRHLLDSDIFVNSSFVESYSASAAEALYLGVPSVFSYAGAMPGFSSNGDVALYYSPGDFVDCAFKIEKLFNTPELYSKFSNNAVEKLKRMCGYDNVRYTQLNIYKDFILKTEGSQKTW